MQKYLITQSSENISDYVIFKAEDYSVVKDYVENTFIKDHAHTILSKGNFTRYFKNLDNLMKKYNSEYIYYYDDREFVIYSKDGIMKLKIWEDFWDKKAIVYETDVQEVHIITEKVYDKMLQNIDKLRVLYNDVEKSNMDYTMQFSFLDNYEFAGFSNDLLDYNDFDYTTGEIKEVNYVNGSSNNESPLEIVKINHDNVKEV
jgi:hypothetical protein